MNKIYSFLGIALLLTLGACNDEYMEHLPETSIGAENFFNTEDDLKMYLYNLYSFPGVWSYANDGYMTTDNASNTGSTEVKNIMLSANPTSATISSGWDWEQLRNINLFLANYKKADLSDDLLAHYEGIARYFRARFYVNKVKRYSNVPWYDLVIGTSDDEALFKASDPREFVVDRIFEDYDFASSNVHEDQPYGAVNKWIVLAYKARHALHEGTFRKYHAELNMQSSANKYLQIARDAAKEIMDSKQFAIHNTGNPASDYYGLFVSEDLHGNSEIIFANTNIDEVKNSGWWEFMFGNYEVSPAKDLLQAYLMTDGSFYTAQAGYETKNIIEEFEDRDPRLYQTFAYPGWELINTTTYSQGGGIYKQQLQKNFTGYHQIKGFINDKDATVARGVDFPVLRFAEILLIYAEARAELGELTQEDLNNTVNLLRSRATMPHLMMNPELDPLQEARYPMVNGSQKKEILEIRRERRIELALEGYRYDDIMRWNAGKLLEKEPEGPYFSGLGKHDITGDGIEDIVLLDLSETVPAAEDKEVNELGEALIYYRVGPQDSDASFYLNGDNQGTVSSVKDRGEFIEPKYYYRPIPQTHVTVNPNLKQVFGWD